MSANNPLSLNKLLSEYASLPEYSEMGVINISTVSLFGEYPINIAATRGILEEVKLLISSGADINASGEHGYTPLHNAVEQGHVDIVRFLVAKGADVGKRNDNGETPAELATLMDEKKIQKLLSRSLIDAWFSAQNIDVNSDEYDEVSWAVDELFNMAHDEPDKLLIIIQDILHIDSSKKTLGAIGAGALEDLLVHHGDDYIDKIIEISNFNANFKAAFQFTYIDKDDVSEDVYKKVLKLKEDSLNMA